MEVNSGAAINQGLIGMQKSQTEMVRSAQQIAEAGTAAGTTTDSAAGGDLIEPLINLKIQSQIFDSSARVVKSADETLGRLLDVKA